jgi:hypothetical protein
MRIRIRDHFDPGSGMEKFVIAIRDKHPGSATLVVTSNPADFSFDIVKLPLLCLIICDLRSCACISRHRTTVMRPSRDLCVTHDTTLPYISIASAVNDISVYHTGAGHNVQILRYPKFTDRPPSENKSERSRHTHEYCRLCIRKDLSKTQLSSLSCTIPSLEIAMPNEQFSRPS